MNQPSLPNLYVCNHVLPTHPPTSSATSPSTHAVSQISSLLEAWHCPNKDQFGNQELFTTGGGTLRSLSGREAVPGKVGGRCSVFQSIPVDAIGALEAPLATDLKTRANSAAPAAKWYRDPSPTASAMSFNCVRSDDPKNTVWHTSSTHCALRDPIKSNTHPSPLNPSDMKRSTGLRSILDCARPLLCCKMERALCRGGLNSVPPPLKTNGICKTSCKVLCVNATSTLSLNFP